MLQDPRAKSALERISGAMVAVRSRADGPPAIDDALVNSIAILPGRWWKKQRMLFNHLVWEDRNFMEFFTADYTFLSSDLAELYDLPAPPDEFALVKYPADSGRSGVLGHGAFLVATRQACRDISDGARFVRSQPFFGPRSSATSRGGEHGFARCHERRAHDEP